MMNNLKIAEGQDLGQLEELATEINKEHLEYGATLRRGLEHALKAGIALMKAKDEIPHGEWERWVKENLSCSKRTAETYMQIARNWDTLESKIAQKAQELADFGLEQALKLLAKPKIKAAKKEAAEMPSHHKAAQASPKVDGDPSILEPRPLPHTAKRESDDSCGFTPVIHEAEGVSSEKKLSEFHVELAAAVGQLKVLAERATQLESDNDDLITISDLVADGQASFARLKNLVDTKQKR